jgi:hypothetical protein
MACTIFVECMLDQTDSCLSTFSNELCIPGSFNRNEAISERSCIRFVGYIVDDNITQYIFSVFDKEVVTFKMFFGNVSLLLFM